MALKGKLRRLAIASLHGQIPDDPVRETTEMDKVGELALLWPEPTRLGPDSLFGSLLVEERLVLPRPSRAAFDDEQEGAIKEKCGERGLAMAFL